MEIIKGITSKDNQSLIDMYCDFFESKEEIAIEIIQNVVDRNNSYIKRDDNDEIIAAALITNKRIIDNKKMFIVGNISVIMTKDGFRNMGHTTDLLKTAIKKWEMIYDSVTMSVKNWDDFSFLDLEDSNSKEVYSYIKGVYPTPMISTFENPNEPDIISEVNNNRYLNDEDKNWMLIDKEDRIKNTKLLQDIFKYKFIANPKAYVWYNENNEIFDYNFEDIASLTWLFHTIQPNGKILFAKNVDLSEVKCLKKENIQVVTVKTTKKSKYKLEILDYIDYFY